MPGGTLFSALVVASQRFGRHDRGQWEDMRPGRYSYGDLLKLSLALGRMAMKETREGEHVGVLMPNMVASVGLLVGLSAFRRIPCLLNYTAGSDGIQNACHAAGIRTVFTSRAFLAKANLAAQAEALQGVRLCYLEDLRARFDIVDKLWLTALALRAPMRAVPAGDPESPAVVLFTSGSEGKPKGVVLSHRAILANVDQIMRVIKVGPEYKFFNALPIFHAFGLTAGVFLPMVSGARLLLYPSPLHYKTIPELVRERRCNVLFSTGTFLSQYAQHAGAGDFHGLKLVIAGAERLPEPVRQTWQERFGVEILEGYGATEMAPVVSVNLPEANRAGTVGPPLPAIEASLVPVPGIEKGGELHLRGPNLMSGYYLMDQPGVLRPPRSSLGPGWHATGDVVEMDADGFITIAGRLRRFAKVAGEMVCLDVAEAIARSASAEALHAATWAEDASRGEAIHLFTTDSGLTREQLVAAAQGLGYPELAVPRRIHLLHDLPLLGSGKIDYGALRSILGVVP